MSRVLRFGLGVIALVGIMTLCAACSSDRYDWMKDLELMEL